MGLNILIPGLLIIAFLTFIVSAGFITDAIRRITNINNYQANPDLSRAHTLSAACAVTAWLTVFFMLLTVILLFVFAREKLTANKGIFVYASFIISLIGTLIVGVLSILTAQNISSANVPDNQGSYRQAVIAAVLSIVVFSLIIITLIIRVLYKPKFSGACPREGGDCSIGGGIQKREYQIRTQPQYRIQERQVQSQVQEPQPQYQIQEKQVQPQIQERQVQPQYQAPVQNERGLNEPLYQFMRALPRENVVQEVRREPIAQQGEQLLVPPLSVIPQYVYTNRATRTQEPVVGLVQQVQQQVPQQIQQEPGINMNLLQFMRGLPRQEVEQLQQIPVVERTEDYLVPPLTEIPQYVYTKGPRTQPAQQQPQYEQQYEQPQYEQPQYEQPQYEQPQYEQPQYEQPQYEQQYEQPLVEDLM